MHRLTLASCLLHTELDNTANFLSQVGDYTYSLSKKVDHGQELSEKEINQLNELSQYAVELNKKLQEMQNEMLRECLDSTHFPKFQTDLAQSSACF